MVASNKEKTQKIPPKPTVLEVIPENIPEELKAIPNWMCWCYELRQKKEVVFGEGRNDKSLVLSPSAHEPLRSVDKRQEATERKRRARPYIATDVFTAARTPKTQPPPRRRSPRGFTTGQTGRATSTRAEIGQSE